MGIYLTHIHLLYQILLLYTRNNRLLRLYAIVMVAHVGMFMCQLIGSLSFCRVCVMTISVKMTTVVHGWTEYNCGRDINYLINSLSRNVLFVIPMQFAKYINQNDMRLFVEELYFQ